MIFFNLQVNKAGAPCPLPSQLLLGHSGPEPDPCNAGPLPPCHIKKRIKKKKYVDDLSLLESLNLKTALVPTLPVFGPPILHEHPGLTLPPED